MVLAQTQTWRPVEQNRGPRYESTQPTLFRQKHQKHMMENRTASSTNVAGKSGYSSLKLDPCYLPVLVSTTFKKSLSWELGACFYADKNQLSGKDLFSA
jgi:hypothetical protein